MMSRNMAIGALLALAVGCEERDTGSRIETREDEWENTEETAEPQPSASAQGTGEQGIDEQQGTETQALGQAQHPANLGGTSSTGGTSGTAMGGSGTGGSGTDPQIEGRPGSGAYAEQDQPQDPAMGESDPQAMGQGSDPYAQGVQQPSGQLVTREAEGTLSSTVSRVQRELRDNDFEVISVLRYDEAQRERAAQRLQQQEQQAQGQQAQGQTAGAMGARDQQAEQQQQQGAAQQQDGQQQQAAAQQAPENQAQGAQGEQAQGQQAQGQQAQQAQAGAETGGSMSDQQIGDVRLILYRRADAENVMLGEGNIQSLLEAPRQIAVFERGDGVVIAYQEPIESAAVPGTETAAQVLDRIVVSVVTPTEQQTEQQGAIASTEVERRGQGQNVETGDMNEAETDVDDSMTGGIGEPTWMDDPTASVEPPEAGVSTEG